MLFRHRNNTDVAIDILKRFYVKEKRVFKLKVRWIDIGPHAPRDTGFEQRLTIPLDVWSKDWITIILEEGETWRDYYYQKIKGPCARESAERFKAFQQVASRAKGAPETEPKMCSVWREKEVGSAP